MKLLASTPLKDIFGRTIFSEMPRPAEGDTPASEGKAMTVGDACIAALLGSYEDEKHLSGDKKFERYALASKIHGGEVDLRAEDISLLKSLVGKLFTPALVGPVYDLLDPRTAD